MHNTMVSMEIPGPIPSMTPISAAAGASHAPLPRRLLSSSSTKSIDAPDMYPYSLSTRRLAASFSASSASPASTLSKMARPLGCTAQKRSFPSAAAKAERQQRVGQAPSNVLADQRRHAAGWVEDQSGFVQYPGGAAVGRLWYHGL